MKSRYGETKIKRNIKRIGCINLVFVFLFWFILDFFNKSNNQVLFLNKTRIVGSIFILAIAIIMILFEIHTGWIEKASDRRYITLEVILSYILAFQFIVLLVNIKQGIEFLNVTTFFIGLSLVVQFIHSTFDFVVEKFFQ